MNAQVQITRDEYIEAQQQIVEMAQSRIDHQRNCKNEELIPNFRSYITMQKININHAKSRITAAEKFPPNKLFLVSMTDYSDLL